MAAQEHAAIYPESWDRVGLAAVALAGADADGYARHLAEAQRLGALTGSHVVRYWTLLLEASRLAPARRAEAARLAGEALRESREHGPFAAMWVDADAVAEACALALESGVEVDEARSLIARLRLDPPATRRTRGHGRSRYARSADST